MSQWSAPLIVGGLEFVALLDTPPFLPAHEHSAVLDFVVLSSSNGHCPPPWLRELSGATYAELRRIVAAQAAQSAL